MANGSKRLTKTALSVEKQKLSVPFQSFSLSLSQITNPKTKIMKRLITFLCIQVSITLGILGAVTETFDDESVFPAFGLGGITATQHTGAFGDWTLYDGNGMKVYGLTDI